MARPRGASHAQTSVPPTLPTLYLYPDGGDLIRWVWEHPDPNKWQLQIRPMGGTEFTNFLLFDGDTRDAIVELFMEYRMQGRDAGNAPTTQWSNIISTD